MLTCVVFLSLFLSNSMMSWQQLHAASILFVFYYVIAYVRFSCGIAFQQNRLITLIKTGGPRFNSVTKMAANIKICQF